MHHATRDRRLPLRPHRRPLRLLAIAASLLVVAVLPVAQTHAQATGRPGDFGMIYTQERVKFVGSAPTDFFYLRGATLDLSYSLWKGIGVSGTGTGLAATNVRGDIDFQHIQFLVGPRYTFNLGRITETTWARRGGIFAEGKVGYTIAPAGYYPSNGVLQTHASSLTYYGGGGINITIYHRFDLRIIDAGIVRTMLPNGSTNIQNTLRLASGVNFHLGP